MATTPGHLVRRIISGGQTGVDRGALDAAIALGIEHGGWCPKGRLAEDGVIPPQYQVQETKSADYPVRTEQNVLDSDGTLILYRGQMQGGTELTYRLACKHRKPLLLVDLSVPSELERIRFWLSRHTIETLNVGGPRESSAPGVAAQTFQLLCSVLRTPTRQ